MNASDLKPLVKPALAALALLFAHRPLLQMALHLVEGAILSALDNGDLDAVIKRATSADTSAPAE